MVQTFVDSTLEDLSTLISFGSLDDTVEAQMKAFQVDLRFLQLFLRCLINLDPDNGIDRMLISSILSSLKDKWDNAGKGLYIAGQQARKKKFQGWVTLASKLAYNILQCKQEIKKCCVQFLSSSFKCNPLPFPCDEIVLDLLDEILKNSKNLHLPVENQFETLRKKLLSLKHLVEFAGRRCPDVKELTDFMIHVRTWGNKAACLTCLYWAGGEDEVEDEGNRWITVLLREVNPCTPEFIKMCFAAMASTKSSGADTSVDNEFVVSFNDFLLDTVAMDDDLEILGEDWIFLMSYSTDPPADNYALTFQPQALLLGDASHSLFDNTEGDLTVDRAIQLDFVSKIRTFRGEIQERHVQIPDFSLPTTDRLGFVKHVLGKIEDLTTTMECNPKIAPFAKHIFRVKEGLTSLSLSIHVVWELQSKRQELKDLLDRMINVVYEAELAVNSSFTIDNPIWYHVSCLSSVLVRIKGIQDEFGSFGMFDTSQIHGIATSAEDDVPVYMPPDIEFSEAMVGFEDEEEKLATRLTRGPKSLDIFTIVGMAGLGKTTLARKVYSKSFVRLHFDICAFCHVGQDCNTRRLLLEILKAVMVIDEAIRDLTEDDLKYRLHQYLKGRRYFIILDDIWDASAWDGVKGTFPDDSNGSRIVFTTRMRQLAVQISSDSMPFDLRFLSDNESWELLQRKVFHGAPTPPQLKKVGFSIATKCQGLPLSIVVIAGVLARTEKSLSFWNEIAKDISSHAASEGGMEILELSYKHLPEAVKSCLLYFGAFLKKKSISAKRLMLLWAAEGFLPKSSESNNSFTMAKIYLDDLVHRSLVVVFQGSSTGGIKRCGVHNLVRELCRMKAREEQFFHFIERSNGSNIASMLEIYKQYRLCIHVKLESEENTEARRDNSAAHSLIYYYPNFPCSVDALPFSNVKLVQVLDAKAECDAFPEEVTMLDNLRYLTLKTYTLSSVPSIIANLWNLETFVLNCFLKEKIRLPETIWKMKKLKHVDVGPKAVVELDNDIGKDSSKLPNIETFSSVTITYGESGKELLRRLQNVRKLSCYYYTCLDWERKSDQLPKLDEYLTNLESLNIISDGAFYPRVPSFPKTLKKLSLEGVDLPWSEFSTIAELPLLEALKLMPNAFWGSIWEIKFEVFPKLKYLKLCGLDVEEWIVSADESFPMLEQIIMKSCYNLVAIPDSLNEVSTLRLIEVYDCNEGVGDSAIQMQKDQQEFGNTILQVQVIQKEQQEQYE